jgi:glutathione S-transferase
MTLKLHHLNASRSQRLVWLLEELNAPHEIIHYTRNAETNLAPETLLEIHPLGKSPLLEDGQLVIAETGAIAEYLLAKYDLDHKLHPEAGSADYARYIEWVHAAEGAPFLPFLLVVYLRAANAEGSAFEPRLIQEQMKVIAFIEQHLSQNAYFAGDNFSAADCLMGFNIQNMSMHPAFNASGATAAWLEKVKQRPAYQRMLAVGV